MKVPVSKRKLQLSRISTLKAILRGIVSAQMNLNSVHMLPLLRIFVHNVDELWSRGTLDLPPLKRHVECNWVLLKLMLRVMSGVMFFGGGFFGDDGDCGGSAAAAAAAPEVRGCVRGPYGYLPSRDGAEAGNGARQHGDVSFRGRPLKQMRAEEPRSRRAEGRSAPAALLTAPPLQP